MLKGSMPPRIGHMELLARMQRADFSEHIQRFKPHGNPLNSPHFDAPNTKFAPTGYRRTPNHLHRFSQLNDSCFLKESDWLVYRIDWTFGIILYLWNNTNRLIVRIHTNKSAPFSHWLNITAEVALGPKILEVPSPQTHVPLRWKIVTWPTSDETTVVTYTVPPTSFHSTINKNCQQKHR